MAPLAPCFALSAPLSTPSPAGRRTAVCSPRRAARVRYQTRILRAVADPPAEPDREAPPASVPPTPAAVSPPTPPQSRVESNDSDILDLVPGKIELSDAEYLEQKKALDAYTAELRRARELKEREDARLFGWVKYAETMNGRFAMFFFVTGLLTEYWTGYTIPEQIELMLRTLGII